MTDIPIAYALSLLLVLNVIHTRLLYMTGKAHYESSHCTVPIFDVGHRLLPDLHTSGWWLNSLLPLITLVMAVLREDRMTVLRDISRLAIPLLLARMVTTSLTIPPPTKENHTCVTDRPSLVHFVEGHCYDFMFSGHTAVMMAISAVLFGVNSPIAWAFTVVQMIVLVLTRSHYTVDVVVSAIMGWGFLRGGVKLP